MIAAAFLLLFSVTFFHPHYAIWLVPFLALTVPLHADARRLTIYHAIQITSVLIYSAQWGSWTTWDLLEPLLGDRVSTGAKLFLVTIAVVDDVIAILVIAVVYSSSIELVWLAGAGLGLLVVAVMRRAQIASPLAYVPVAVAIWVATLESGVHPTIAGVALGLMTPAKPVRGRAVLEELEHRLHPVSAFVVLPAFALANAGVEIGGDAFGTSTEVRLGLGVALGLILGKLVGIGSMTWLAVRTGAGRLPEGVGRRTALGVAALGGIGFTVSLFIAPLAFSEPALVDSAKLGILGGSVIAALVGIAILAGGPRSRNAREADAGA